MSKISVVGTGYVGLVTGTGLASLGHEVTCNDIDESRIARLQNGRLPFFEEGLEKLVHEGIYSSRLKFTTDLSESLTEAQYAMIAVGTPEGSEGDPDLSQVFSVVQNVAKNATHDLVIIVKSTVPVGCFSQLRTIIQEAKSPHAIELVSCREFLAEGSAVHDFFHPSRTIVGASTEKLARDVMSLFAGVTGPRIYTTPETAQIIKYASNSFLASRIAFINEIARICELFSVDIHDVEKGILLDPRFGTGYLRAGIGYGGPCLSKDLAALSSTARMAGYESAFCQAIAAQNKGQIQHTVDQLCSLAAVGESIAIFGLAFKAGTSDVRNSLAVKIAESLLAQDRKVTASDPVAFDEANTLLGSKGVMCYENPWKAAAGSHVQAFLTAWPEYKQIQLDRLRSVVARTSIFDGPGIFDPHEVRTAGFNYCGIGRINADPFLIIES